MGKYKEAVSDYSQAIKINPANVIFYFNRAIVYEKMKDMKMAKEDLCYFIKHASSHLNPLIKYAKGRIRAIGNAR